MNLKTKQLLAVGLSVVGSVGTIGTAILARKAAMKESVVRKKVHNFDSLSSKEKIKVLLPIYIPTGIAGITTIGSIIGSSIISKRAQASIMSMAVIADQGWRKYKNQVKSVLGIEAHEDILKSMSKRDQIAVKEHLKRDETDMRELYYMESVGYFQALPEDIAYAYAAINEIISGAALDFPVDEAFNGVTIGQFLKLAKANIIDSSITDEELNSWGWTMDYLHDTTDNMWIHIRLVDEETIDDDEPKIPYKVISWLEEPILIYEEDYEERLDLDFDDPHIEYATYGMFGYKKGPDGKLVKIENDNKEEDPNNEK